MSEQSVATRSVDRSLPHEQPPLPTAPAAPAATERVARLLPLLCVLSGLGLGQPVLLLLGVAAATAFLLRPVLPRGLAVPAAVCLLLAVAVTLGLAADALDLDLLAAGWPVAVTSVVLAAVAASVTPRGDRARTGGGGAWWTSAPAWGAVAAACAQVRDGTVARWSLGSSDPAQHVWFIGEIQRSGVLDYGADGYPRALHMLLALVAAPGAPADGTAALLARDLELYGGATWLALAALLATIAAVTRALADSAGLSRRASDAATLGVGVTLLLSNAVVSTYLFMGAAPAVLALVVMLLLPLHLLRGGRRDAARLVALAAVSSMLLAHLWQALVVVPVAVLCTLVVFRAVAWRRPPGGGRPRLEAVGLCVVVLVSVVLAAPALLGIQARGGVSLAATPGELPAVPWVVLGLGLAACWPLVRARRAAPQAALLGGVLGLLAVVGVMLLGTGSVDLTQYYPTKASWFATVFVSPVLAVRVAAWSRAVPAVLRGLSRPFGPAARVVRLSVVAAVVLLGGAWFAPTASPGSMAFASVLPSAHSSHVARQHDLAAELAHAYAPAVTVPVGITVNKQLDISGAYVVAKMMAFQTGQEVNFGAPQNACADVGRVAPDGRAVVITDLDVALLARAMDEQGCGAVRVVQLEGGLDSAAEYQNQVLSGRLHG